MPHGHWKVVTLTASIRPGGVGGCLAFGGATDSAAFEAFVGSCPAPALRHGDIVIMDNLSCHKTAEAARLIAGAGAEVRSLPPYSPDLNPIERMFSKLEASFRKAKARPVESLHDAIGEGLRTVTASDIAGRFRSSGYRHTQT